MGTSDAVPFGVTVSAESLERARKFYTNMYPDYASITEGVFGTIKYFSLIGKDGEVLVNVLQRQDDMHLSSYRQMRNSVCHKMLKAYMTYPPMSFATSVHQRVQAPAGAPDAMFYTDSADFSLTFDTDHSSVACLANPTFGEGHAKRYQLPGSCDGNGDEQSVGWDPLAISHRACFTLGDQVALNALNEFDSVHPSSSLLPPSLNWQPCFSSL
jgi:hypothetical protein